MRCHSVQLRICVPDGVWYLCVETFKTLAPARSLLRRVCGACMAHISGRVRVCCLIGNTWKSFVRNQQHTHIGMYNSQIQERTLTPTFVRNPPTHHACARTRLFCTNQSSDTQITQETSLFATWSQESTLQNGTIVSQICTKCVSAACTAAIKVHLARAGKYNIQSRTRPEQQNRLTPDLGTHVYRSPYVIVTIK